MLPRLSHLYCFWVLPRQYYIIHHWFKLCIFIRHICACDESRFVSSKSWWLSSSCSITNSFPVKEQNRLYGQKNQNQNMWSYQAPEERKVRRQQKLMMRRVPIRHSMNIATTSHVMVCCVYVKILDLIMVCFVCVLYTCLVGCFVLLDSMTQHCFPMKLLNSVCGRHGY